MGGEKVRKQNCLAVFLCRLRATWNQVGCSCRGESWNAAPLLNNAPGAPCCRELHRQPRFCCHPWLRRHGLHNNTRRKRTGNITPLAEDNITQPTETWSLTFGLGLSAPHLDPARWALGPSLSESWQPRRMSSVMAGAKEVIVQNSTVVSAA